MTTQPTPPPARRPGSAGPGRSGGPGRAAWRVAARIALATLLAAGGLAVGGPAPAAEAAACSGSSGVTVVVDSGALGGGIQTACAGGDPGSGLAALSGAGHGYTFVPRQPGLVCQIDSRPNPCNGAPTTAYWSYWHASRGGSWSFSSLGAGSYNPSPGTVEGWAFGAGRRPGIAPPAAPAPLPPAPKPTTKPAPKPPTGPPVAPPRTSAPGMPGAPPASGSRSDPGSVTGGRPGTGTGTSGGSASAGSGRTTAAPSTSAGPTATAGTSANGAPAPSTSDSSPPAAPQTEPESSSKTLGAFSLAVALIAALGLAGFLVARRRRTTGPPV